MTPVLRVRVGPNAADRREFTFDKPFRIGRVEERDVCIKDEHVSRNHAEVTFENGQWWVRDLQSSNGVWIGDRRVDRAPVDPALTVRLGIYGPEVSFEVEPPPPAPEPAFQPEPVQKAPPGTETIGRPSITRVELR